MTFAIRFLKCAIFAAAVLTPNFANLEARASSLTLDDISRGAYFQNGTFGGAGSGDPDGNYLTGDYDQTYVNRSFFTFDLSSILGTITSAQLNIATVLDPYTSGPPATFKLVAYAGNIAALDNNEAGVAGFGELASGIVLASLTVDPTAVNVDGTLSIALDPAALAAIQLAEGSDFAIGGSLVTTLPQDSLFGYSEGAPPAELVLTTSPTPEPSSLLLLATGGLGIAGGLMRKRLALRGRSA